MGVSKRCTGRNLFNYLKQKNISIDISYEHDKVSQSWSGVLTVFDVGYTVSGKQNKTDVTESLMCDAESFIYSNISNIKSKNE